MLITQMHKQKCLAKVAERAAADNKNKLRPAVVLRKGKKPGAGASRKQQTDGDVIAAALAQDLDALKQLESVDAKVELKKQLVPKWREVVDQYRESGAQHHFEPLVRLVIWLLDIGQVDAAMEYADFAIAQQQPMPDGFKRDLPAYTAEEVHNWAERQLKADASAEPFLTQLIERVESKAWPVTQVIVNSKIYRIAGMLAERDGDLKKAEGFYLKCVEVNPKGHGVKTKLGAVQARLAGSA